MAEEAFIHLLEDPAMLGNPTPPPPTDFDRQVFERIVPSDHFLRRALDLIPWDSMHEILADTYSPNTGRPSEPPVLMLKLEYLRYQYNLSDRQVIDRAKTDMAFRLFLQVDFNDQLVVPSALTYFRGRLGVDGFRRVFDQIVAHARENNLVKERMRLKDATHILANINVPSAMTLIAQVRDNLLAAVKPFDPVWVEGERVDLELLRDRTKSLGPQERLATRVTYLREILTWVDELPTPEEAKTKRGLTYRQWQKFLAQRDLAHKILFDQDNPQAGDRTRSAVDSDARRSKHGIWYDGYELDMLLDPDSEIFTQINLLADSREEAVDAIRLIRQEEAVHGNDIEAISIDGVGWNGAVLRELQDPEDLAIETFVPPSKEVKTTVFKPSDFVEDVEQGAVRCPANQVSTASSRSKRNTATIYRFKGSVCAECPLKTQCLNRPSETKLGRSVHKNDYAAEYHAAREKAKTEEYGEVRSEHMKVERKLGEVMNLHGGRRARYWGIDKVLVQELMAVSATNVKRIVKLLSALGF